MHYRSGAPQPVSETAAAEMPAEVPAAEMPAAEMTPAQWLGYFVLMCALLAVVAVEFLVLLPQG